MGMNGNDDNIYLEHMGYEKLVLIRKEWFSQKSIRTKK